VPYPSIERERAILAARVPELPEQLADKIARTVSAIRSIPLRKSPSVSETIDWARTLLALGIEELDDDSTSSTLNVLLKYQTDIERVAKELSLDIDQHVE
jgi:MoxR-like ATPase